MFIIDATFIHAPPSVTNFLPKCHHRKWNHTFVSPLVPTNRLFLYSRRSRFPQGQTESLSVRASTQSGSSDSVSSAGTDKFPESNIGGDAANESQETNQRDAPDDTVVLPIVDAEELKAEASWLESELSLWLNNEWKSDQVWDAHRTIAKRAAQLHQRLRAEHIDDLSTLALGLAAGLDSGSNSVDFTNAYTSPWDVAHKTEDLLLSRFFPSRAQIQEKERLEQNRQFWQQLDDAFQQMEDMNYSDRDISDGVGDGQHSSGNPTPPCIVDEFERYRFLQMVLNGAASKSVSRQL